MLTGALVFEGEGLQQLVKRLHDDPVPPSQRTELPIPRDSTQIVMALLAREPRRRPSRRAELYERLHALPIPRWTDAQAAEWWRLHDRDTATPDPLCPLRRRLNRGDDRSDKRPVALVQG